MKNIVLAFAELVGAETNPRYELKIATVDSPADMLNNQIKAYLTFLSVTGLPFVLAHTFKFHPILPTVDTVFPESHFADILESEVAQVGFDFMVSNSPSLEVYKLEDYGDFEAYAVFEVYVVILNNLRIETRTPIIRFLDHSFNQMHFMSALGNDPILQHILQEIDNKQIPISR